MNIENIEEITFLQKLKEENDAFNNWFNNTDTYYITDGARRNKEITILKNGFSAGFRYKNKN